MVEVRPRIFRSVRSVDPHHRVRLRRVHREVPLILLLLPVHRAVRAVHRAAGAVRTSEAPSLSDPSDAAVGPPDERRIGDRPPSRHPSARHRPPPRTAAGRVARPRPRRARRRSPPRRLVADARERLPLSADPRAFPPGRWTGAGEGGGRTCDGLGRLEETPKPSALTVAKTSAGIRDRRRPPARDTSAAASASASAAAPSRGALGSPSSSHSASLPAPAPGPGPGAPAPERTPTATSPRSRRVGATRWPHRAARSSAGRAGDRGAPAGATRHARRFEAVIVARRGSRGGYRRRGRERDVRDRARRHEQRRARELGSLRGSWGEGGGGGMPG